MSEVIAQADTSANRIAIQGDLRFRLEHDWNSRRANGTLRDDRSRMRIRMRLGMTYQPRPWLQAGIAVRTGRADNQQDPNITFGLSDSEFSVFALGVSKAYIKLQGAHFSGWFGKNAFPFVTQNELFWCGSVNPEGVTLAYKRTYESGLLRELRLTAGHYIAIANQGGFAEDGYLQGFQLSTRLGDRVRVYPGLFRFRNLPDIPDGRGNVTLDYSVLHLGGDVTVVTGPPLRLGIDFYSNTEDYQNVP
ncbi:MAG: putative porin, partial [Saprospiraceae bacterium]|nr:putative porin [Saprospiraceae bacterium]